MKTIVLCLCFAATLAYSCSQIGVREPSRGIDPLLTKNGRQNDFDEYRQAYGSCWNYDMACDGRPALIMDERLNALLNDHWRAEGSYHTYEFVFRGPLSPGQVHEELTTVEEKVSRKSGLYGPANYYGFPEPLSAQDAEYWSSFTGQYRDGDELYSFGVIANDLGDICNLQGYVLIRGGRVVSTLVTLSS